ncbi:hypothetical protein OO012_01875 [Rhodobacteraceae bacterium KMM 6894]|nr:hypothetical protein [Rhodobacteraceae bacterium KMM 6894]
MKPLFYLSAFALLGACAMPEWVRPAAQSAEPVAAPVAQPVASVTAPPVPDTARTVEEFDTTSAADRVQATKVAVGGRDLGLTVASLGAVGEPGFWLKTPLVSAPGKGRVVYPASGKEVQVDLIPIEGPKTAGSRMSLSALRVIDAPLAGLPELRVFVLE